MGNRLAAFIKVGDSVYKPGKENERIREGSIADIIDESNPLWGGKSLEQICSSWNNTVYVPCIIDRAQYQLYLDAKKAKGVGIVNGASQVVDPIAFRPNRKVLKLETLQKITGDKDLITKARSAESMNFIDLSGGKISLEDFTDEADLPAGVIPDTNLIYNGSYTYGSGGDYATMMLFRDDIANLTGDLTGTCISNISQTGSYLAMNFTLGGYTYTQTSNSDPMAISGGGYVIETSLSAGGYALNERQEGSGIYILEKHDMTFTGGGGTETGMYFYGIGTAFDCHVRRNVFDYDTLVSGLRFNDVTLSPWVYQNCIKDAGTFSIQILTAGSGTKIENNTIISTSDAAGFSIGNIAAYLANNVAYLGGTSTCYGDVGSATGYNNAGNDLTNENGDFSTGSGNLTEISNPFSTTDFQINSGSSLYGAGIAPTIAANTVSANGVSLSQGAGNYDIGAWTVDRSATGANVPQKMINYYRRRM